MANNKIASDFVNEFIKGNTKIFEFEKMTNIYYPNNTNNSLYPESIILYFKINNLNQSNIKFLTENKYLLETDDYPKCKLKIMLEENLVNNNFSVYLGDNNINKSITENKITYCIPENLIREGGKLQLKSFEDQDNETFVVDQYDQITMEMLQNYYGKNMIKQKENKEIKLQELHLEFLPSNDSMCLVHKLYFRKMEETSEEEEITSYYRYRDTHNKIHKMIDLTETSDENFKIAPSWIARSLAKENGKINVSPFIIPGLKADGGSNLKNMHIICRKNSTITNKRKYGRRLKKSGNKSGTNRQGRGKVRSYR